MVPYYLDEQDIDRLITNTGVAVAVLDQHINHPWVDTVYANDEAVILETIRWLIHDRGHRQIGFIGVNGLYATVPRRHCARQGYLRNAFCRHVSV
jgi:DNA-binding LacI/PurR family transcriptional regulator